MNTPNDYDRFAQAVVNAYPQLFNKPVALSTKIYQELREDICTKSDFASFVQAGGFEKKLRRFLATYTAGYGYRFALCRDYLREQPRKGLKGVQPILKGEVLELLLTMQSEIDDEQAIKSLPLARYYFAAKAQVIG